MKIQSRPFGEIEIEEGRVITVHGGMFGFEGYERFVLVGVEEQKPFEWIQCVDEPSIAFVVIQPAVFMPHYQFSISDADKMSLGVQSEADLLCYIVCVIPEDMQKITVNLKGPIAVNPKTCQARQVISMVETHSVRHPLFEPKKDNPSAGTAPAAPAQG